MSESQRRAMAAMAYASAHFMVLGTTEADGRARVAEDDLQAACGVAFAHPRGGARAFTPRTSRGTGCCGSTG